MNKHLKFAFTSLAVAVAQVAFIIFFVFSDHRSVFSSMGFDTTGQYLLLACGCLLTLTSVLFSIYGFAASRQVQR